MICVAVAAVAKISNNELHINTSCLIMRLLERTISLLVSAEPLFARFNTESGRKLALTDNQLTLARFAWRS